MINEDEIVFNDEVDDHQFIQELLSQEEYCRFESMMGEIKQDIYEHKTYGAIWEAADQLAEEAEGYDYSSWIF